MFISIVNLYISVQKLLLLTEVKGLHGPQFQGPGAALPCPNETYLAPIRHGVKTKSTARPVDIFAAHGPARLQKSMKTGLAWPIQKLIRSGHGPTQFLQEIPIFLNLQLRLF